MNDSQIIEELTRLLAGKPLLRDVLRDPSAFNYINPGVHKIKPRTAMRVVALCRELAKIRKEQANEDRPQGSDDQVSPDSDPGDPATDSSAEGMGAKTRKRTRKGG